MIILLRWIPILALSILPASFRLNAGPAVSEMRDAAAFQGSPFAPGMLAVISVTGHRAEAAGSLSASVPWPESFEGLVVEVEQEGRDPLRAAIGEVSPTSIRIVMPESLREGAARLRVRMEGGQSSGDYEFEVRLSAPRLFTQSSDGSGWATACHEDGEPVTPERPAESGEVLLADATGLSLTEAPRVQVGGQEAEVFGVTPKEGAPGRQLVRFAIPAAAVTGELELALQAAGQSSQGGVKIPVRRRAGAEYFVAPDGKSSGAGSKEDPWDLDTALLNARGVVQAGDTIWLRGGRYGRQSRFESRLTGAEGRPIVVRQFPGERATLDGNFFVFGADTWYWGFELTNSRTERTAGLQEGFFIEGPRTKFINLIVHDTALGFGLWSKAIGAEIHGSLIYHNGFQSGTRGAGHGIYTQNETGVKVISGNILFNQFGLGIQAFGSERAFVRGYQVSGNMILNSGIISEGQNMADNIRFESGNSMERIVLEDNYTWQDPPLGRSVCKIGRTEDLSQDIVMRNNYWIGGQMSAQILNWREAAFTGNTAYTANGYAMWMQAASGVDVSKYSWDRNRYFGRNLFQAPSGGQDFNGWRRATGLDANSTFSTGAPSENWVFIRPNQYETGRGHVMIYNWEKRDAVEVNLASLLSSGARYEIRDAQNFFAAPVATGVFTGAPVRIPMTGLTVIAPNGTVPAPPKHTAPDVGVFVVLPLP